MWDYLVLTASNAMQARAYEMQVEARRQCGLLPQVREFLVVPDPEGQRIGSGGSTLLCLSRILERERRRLSELRILIVHAGGDSRRLPAYGPCGKIFVPLPSENCDAPLPVTLFDRLVPDFLALPPGIPGRGQVVVAAGDALVRFDSSQVSFAKAGITAIGCYVTPEEASRHGVFCPGPDNVVSLYLQKPSIDVQKTRGAIDASGRVALDAGVMSLDADAAQRLLDAFGPVEAALASGIDLYREICCALGSAATLDHYLESVRSSGSNWKADAVGRVFPALHRIPLHVQLVPTCRFLHFGSTRQLIESGLALVAEDRGNVPSSTVLVVNSAVAQPAQVRGRDSWMEACNVAADVRFAGHNVMVGVDVDAPLSLPRGACLEVLGGRNRAGADVWFVRCYGVRDTFKQNAQFCGRPLGDWLRTAGVEAGEVWPDVTDPASRSLWNARVFPAVPAAADFRRWLWMFAPESATPEELRSFRAADRYSAAEIAVVANQAAFHSRRLDIWKRRARQSD